MIPLYKPYMPNLPELDNIMHSGQLSYGEWTRKFEDLVKDYFSTQYVLATNTYEHAIYVALAVLDVKQGDEIIASPMGCLASTQPYVSYGARIKWADIDPHRGSLDPQSVEKSITSKTKVIVNNHYCGYAGYVDEINDIGKRYEISVIDDGIECFGTQYKGKKIGSCGTDVTIFSLGAIRYLNCIDGGLLIFNERSLYDKAKLICDNGVNREKFRDLLGEIRLDCDVDNIGYNAKMSNVNGYIGYRQMFYVDELIKLSRLNAEKWDLIIDNLNLIEKIDIKDTLPNYWVYGMLVKNKRMIIEEFRRKEVYASGVHMKNTIYSVFGNENRNLYGVEDFFSKFVAVPCGWWINNTFFDKLQK